MDWNWIWWKNGSRSLNRFFFFFSSSFYCMSQFNFRSNQLKFICWSNLLPLRIANQTNSIKHSIQLHFKLQACSHVFIYFQSKKKAKKKETSQLGCNLIDWVPSHKVTSFGCNKIHIFIVLLLFHLWAKMLSISFINQTHKKFVEVDGSKVGRVCT